MLPLASTPSAFFPMGRLEENRPREAKYGEELYTGVFKLNIDVKDGDDFALTLGHVDITIDTQDLGDLHRNTILFGLNSSELLGEVVLGPVAGVLVDLFESQNTDMGGAIVQDEPSALLRN